MNMFTPLSWETDATSASQLVWKKQTVTALAARSFVQRRESRLTTVWASRSRPFEKQSGDVEVTWYRAKRYGSHGHVQMGKHCLHVGRRTDKTNNRKTRSSHQHKHLELQQPNESCPTPLPHFLSWASTERRAGHQRDLPQTFPVLLDCTWASWTVRPSWPKIRVCHVQVHDLSQARQHVWDRVETPLLAFSVQDAVQCVDAFCILFWLARRLQFVVEIRKPTCRPRDHEVIALCQS